MPEITDNPIPPRASTPTGARAPANESGALSNAASRAGDEAVAIKDDAVGAAAQVKERAATEVGNVAQEARHEASNVVGEVRNQLSGQAEDAARRVGSAIVEAAEELRSMAQSSARPNGTATTVVRQLADRTAQVGNRLESGGYRDVTDDVARFGRNHAGLFLLAAGAAGFAVGRLLRNTDTQAVVAAARDNGDDYSDTSVQLTGPDRWDDLERPVIGEPAYAPNVGASTGRA
jgi:hypothetical protein